MPAQSELNGSTTVLLLRQSQPTEVRAVPVDTNNGVARALSRDADDFGVVGFVRLAEGQQTPTPDAQTVFVNPRQLITEPALDHSTQSVRVLRMVQTRTGGMYEMKDGDTVAFSSSRAKNRYRRASQ